MGKQTDDSPKKEIDSLKKKVMGVSKSIAKFFAKPAFKIRDNFLTFLVIITPVVALFSLYLWFVHTYALTPWELYQITKHGLPTLENLDVLPGYIDIEDLPGYLEARKNTVDLIRDTMKEQDFEMYDLVQLAKCESTINPGAYNYSSGATGLFQYKPITWETTPHCEEDIWDPESQTLATIWMFRHSRHTEWECFRSHYYNLTEIPQPRDYHGCR